MNSYSSGNDDDPGVAHADRSDGDPASGRERRPADASVHPTEFCASLSQAFRSAVGVDPVDPVDAEPTLRRPAQRLLADRHGQDLLFEADPFLAEHVAQLEEHGEALAWMANDDEPASSGARLRVELASVALERSRHDSLRTVGRTSHIRDEHKPGHRFAKRFYDRFDAFWVSVTQSWSRGEGVWWRDAWSWLSPLVTMVLAIALYSIGHTPNGLLLAAVLIGIRAFGGLHVWAITSAFPHDTTPGVNTLTRRAGRCTISHLTDMAAIFGVAGALYHLFHPDETSSSSDWESYVSHGVVVGGVLVLGSTLYRCAAEQSGARIERLHLERLAKASGLLVGVWGTLILQQVFGVGDAAYWTLLAAVLFPSAYSVFVEWPETRHQLNQAIGRERRYGSTEARELHRDADRIVAQTEDEAYSLDPDQFTAPIDNR